MTGVPEVDAAHARLAELRDAPERPLAEHAEVLDAVHRQLHDALTRLDEA